MNMRKFLGCSTGQIPLEIARPKGPLGAPVCTGRHARARFLTGQILIELIIAGLIIIFISLAITQAITSSIRGLDQSKIKTAAVFLSQELTEGIRLVAAEDWHNITNLATTSANKYYLSTTTPNKWTTSAGTQNVTLSSVVYTRYVYLDDVYRLNKDIVSSSTPGAYRDPSTIKVTTNVEWTDVSLGSDTFSQPVYLSRFLNDIFLLTDWVGGPVGTGTPQVITAATTTFATSSSIDYSSTGTIKLQTQ